MKRWQDCLTSIPDSLVSLIEQLLMLPNQGRILSHLGILLGPVLFFLEKVLVSEQAFFLFFLSFQMEL